MKDHTHSQGHLGACQSWNYRDTQHYQPSLHVTHWFHYLAWPDRFFFFCIGSGKKNDPIQKKKSGLATQDYGFMKCSYLLWLGRFCNTTKQCDDSIKECGTGWLLNWQWESLLWLTPVIHSAFISTIFNIFHVAMLWHNTYCTVKMHM